MPTDDSPEREFDLYDERTSNLSESEAIPSRLNPIEIPKSNRKARREVRWLDFGCDKPQLEVDWTAIRRTSELVSIILI